MNRTIRINLWRSLTLVLLVSLVLPWTAFAAVWTDKLDYSPGETVTILGDNSDGADYEPGETVHVDVVGPNDYTAMCDGVAADTDNADWSCQVILWDSDLAVGTYYYTATGLTSGEEEEGTFTDGNYNPQIEARLPDCETTKDGDFALGEKVCAFASGLGNNATGTIMWWDPHSNPADEDDWTRETTFTASGNFGDTWQPFVLGTWTIKLYLEGKHKATATFSVVPDVTIESPYDYEPIPITTPVSVEYSWTDPDPETEEDKFTCRVDWGDGTVEPPADELPADCTSPQITDHDYGYSEDGSGAGAGLYEITITVVDDHGGIGTASITVVMYDPDAGFVTGGGWFISEPGWYQKPGQVEELGGEATFGFVSKYQRGATVPVGETEFQFHRADFSFHSDTYDWLVVNKVVDGVATNAQYQGEGTIDGELGIYNFQLWATDGETDNVADTFRIKIWEKGGDEEKPYYDNIEPAAIVGGNIIIHTSGK